MTVKYPPRIEFGLGGPPRIEPLAPEELGDAGWMAMSRSRDLTGYPKDAPLHPFLATMCRHTEMFERFMQFGMNFLNNSVIGPREREMIILRTGWLCDAPYEWCEHVAAGLREGLTEQEIGWIREGPEAGDWNERDRSLLRAVDELHDTSMISDEVWSALAEHLDERQLLELPVLVGHYHMTAFLQNAIRFEPNRDRFGQPLEQESPA
ncbi:MAG: carboxymuconolactone decarboxylase family protein [Novosphingobium sp.]|nr:carboxymuconolactone decarboxylase family protein [Novosphingobium sp.]MCP5401202.1 carboxymuconolactone decarboxylase family protein [Novosphingobium sp.]